MFSMKLSLRNVEINMDFLKVYRQVRLFEARGTYVDIIVMLPKIAQFFIHCESARNDKRKLVKRSTLDWLPLQIGA